MTAYVCPPDCKIPGTFPGSVDESKNRRLHPNSSETEIKGQGALILQQPALFSAAAASVAQDHRWYLESSGSGHTGCPRWPLTGPSSSS